MAMMTMVTTMMLTMLQQPGALTAVFEDLVAVEEMDFGMAPAGRVETAHRLTKYLLTDDISGLVVYLGMEYLGTVYLEKEYLQTVNSDLERVYHYFEGRCLVGGKFPPR